MPQLKDFLARIRSKHGTQVFVAEKLEIASQLLGQYERGERNPKLGFYKKWKKLFGEDLEAMMDEANASRETQNGTRVNKTAGSVVKEMTLSGKIPFYDTIAVGGNTMLAEQQPISEPAEYIDPGDLLKGASGTLRIYGHSMFPKYPSGCIVAFKQSKSKVIVWGEDYVIELEDRRIIKRVEKSKEKEHIKAVSYNVNSEKYVYDPIDIPLSEVRRLYMVLGKVELEASI